MGESGVGVGGELEQSVLVPEEPSGGLISWEAIMLALICRRGRKAAIASARMSESLYLLINL